MTNRHPQSSSAFTIVELLIVVVIIAILAAITVSVYAGVQNRAYNVTVQGDLANIGKKIRLFYDTNGRWPNSPTDLTAADLRVTRSAYSRGMYNGSSWYNLVYCWPNTADPYSFALVAQSKSGDVYQFSGGKSSQAAYSFGLSSGANCTAAGVDISTSGRDWFYENDAWNGYAKS